MVYLVEGAFRADSKVTKFLRTLRTSFEKRAPHVNSGIGEPGVKRGVPKMISEKALLATVAKEVNGVGLWA